MGTNLNKSPVHLGYINEIHRLNTEFDVIELIQSIQTIQSSRVDDKTFADYIRVWLDDSDVQTLVDCTVVQCRNWRIAQSCNADIWEWYSRAMQTSRDYSLGPCRHWAIVHTCNSNIRCLYSRAIQTLCDWTVVQLRYWVIVQSCNADIGWFVSPAIQTFTWYNSWKKF